MESSRGCCWRLKQVVDVLTRTPPKSTFFGVLIFVDLYRIPLGIHVRPASIMSVICLEHLIRALAPMLSLRFPT